MAVEKIKHVLTSTQTMIPPQRGRLLRVYLTVREEAISGLINQEEEGRERPIAYVSRTVKDVELRYSAQENYCFALVYIIFRPSKQSCFRGERG